MEGKTKFLKKIILYIALIPIFILIIYYHVDSQNVYVINLKKHEIDLANALLAEESFIIERMTSSPNILSNKEDLKSLTLLGNGSDINNILINNMVSNIDNFGIGIYSFSRNEIVLHLGNDDIYNQISSQDLKQKITSNDSFFTKLNGELVYIVPLKDGFIYSFYKDFQEKSFNQLFFIMLAALIILTFFGVKGIEEVMKKRIEVLKEDVKELKEKDKPLSVYNDQFKEIAVSINDLKEHYTKQKERLYTILDSLPLAIIYYDNNGQVIYVNKTTTQVTGFSKEEIKNFSVSGNLLNNTENVFWNTLRSGESFLGFESYCPTKEGKEIPVMTTTKPLYDADGNQIGIISSFIDVSEQDRLRKIEQNAQVMLDHISDGVMMVDNRGIINGFNRGAEEMTGFKAEDVLGKKYDDIFIKRKTIFTKLTQTLFTKKEYTNYKKEIAKRDGQKIYLMITTKILLDKNGQQIGAMGIYKDITYLEELSQQIQRADKLAVVGELAAGTAHEIRNPLTTIKGFIQFLKEDIYDERKREYVNLMLKEINHINDIIREMLLLAKPSHPSKSMVSINNLIDDITSFMNSEAVLYNVELKSSLGRLIPPIPLDERQIKQVFINIIRNGIQAMKTGGILTVTSEYNSEQKMVTVLFVDQGEGIPQEQITKIYEPFYTTKDEGTGLGIPVSYRIMQNHGGDLKINSIFGRGTKVTLFFPLSTDDSEEERKE